jgi:hypothetical protein
MPWPYGGIVEFLALTGQRREEVAQARPGEINAEARTWCIPGDRTKNRKGHIVHLSEPAWALICGHLTGKYIFPTATGRYFQVIANQSACSTNSPAFAAGVCMISGAPSFPAWPAWVFHPMLLTKFSTTSQEQSQGSQRSTSGMISLPNARTHSIDGELTSPNWFDSFKANGDP